MIGYAFTKGTLFTSVVWYKDFLLNRLYHLPWTDSEWLLITQPLHNCLDNNIVFLLFHGVLKSKVLSKICIIGESNKVANDNIYPCRNVSQGLAQLHNIRVTLSDLQWPLWSLFILHSKKIRLHNISIHRNHYQNHFIKRCS